MTAAAPVLITGLGLVAPHGMQPRPVFEALMRAESAVCEWPALGQRPVAAACVNFDCSPWFTKLQLAGVDRVSQLAVAAAELAWADAQGASGLHAVPGPRIGVYVGCGMGGAAALDSAYQSAAARAGRVSPLTIPAFMPNAAAAHVAMRRRAQGPVLTYSVACASSAIAIAEAAKALTLGEVDVALAGGTEALIVPGVVAAWQAMQTLASFDSGQAANACRPFAADRSGFVLGEGAAFMVLERAEQGLARGARGYARLAGTAVGCDATHLTKPDAAGQARVLAAALARAGLSPQDVGYCNAHGTATRLGDPIEAQALQTVWGAGLADLRVSSTKALHGHLLGAAGALEALITVLALHQQRLPPNAQGHAAAAECPLNLVLEPGHAAPGLRAAISSSFAFGGSNAVLVFVRV